MLTGPTPDARLREAAAALGRGDAATARRLAEPLARGGGVGTQPWAILAEAARQTRDDRLLEEAADRIIQIEPRAVRAYGWKGDCRERAGDARGAAAWYRAGLSAGEGLQGPPQVRAELTRMAEALRAIERVFAAAQQAGLARRGVDAAAVSDRFAESIDLLNGAVELQLQQPTAYYFPGLPQQAFFDRAAFPWVPAVEAATPAIRAELDRALAERAPFQPYMQGRADRPSRNAHGLVGNADWSSLHLIEDGVPNALATERFPVTLAALAAAPLCRIGVRAPTVMFSLLKAGAHIPPHHGMINTRLICHLPLIVPGAGELRVGNRRRAWEEGRLLIFDDTIEHEARNDADADRVVLIFDVWRPELTEAERAAVVALFATIDED